MPTTRQLAKLFQAVSGRDLESAEQIARQIASFEERKGHHSAAQLLRGSLHSNGVRGDRAVKQIAGILTNGHFLEAALSRGQRECRLKDAMLCPAARKSLDEVIVETKHGAYLSSRGIRRENKLLFVGPPGCGKSFTAQAVANELGLPHYIVRFDAVIGAYLGQTAIHLRELFRFASNILRSCYLTIKSTRWANSVETVWMWKLDRIVIALMQELELSRSSRNCHCNVKPSRES